MAGAVADGTQRPIWRVSMAPSEAHRMTLWATARSQAAATVGRSAAAWHDRTSAAPDPRRLRLRRSLRALTNNKLALFGCAWLLLLVSAVANAFEEGGWLEVTMPDAPAPVAPQAVDGMTIVLEDDDLVVVDKPVGVAAHPSPGWEGPTVIGGLAAAGHRVSTSGAEERQGIVHRLDVGTSGCMVVAKSERAYTVLKDAFRERPVDKRYHALVQGHPDPLRGTVDAPIGRHPKHDYKFAVMHSGKHSVTHYETLEAHRFASLLEVSLETGRTHQIRVHMAALKHPCVGDPLYGADPVLAQRLGLERQWLEAQALGDQLVVAVEQLVGEVDAADAVLVDPHPFRDRPPAHTSGDLDAEPVVAEEHGRVVHHDPAYGGVHDAVSHAAPETSWRKLLPSISASSWPSAKASRGETFCRRRWASRSFGSGHSPLRTRRCTSVTPASR